MSTATLDDVDTTAPAAPPVRDRLAAAAGRAGRRAATRPRKATPRKAATAPATSRNERAAKRGKYSASIAPAIKSGATLLAMKNPVASRIIIERADPFAAALDQVAAEDPRVDAILGRVAGWFGKGGAWGSLGQETALIGGALMLSSGMVPGGPAGMVLAMFAGGIVEQATLSVAQNRAEQYFERAGIDPTPSDLATVTAQFAAAINAERDAKITARAMPDTDDAGDQLDDDDVPAPAAPAPASW